MTSSAGPAPYVPEEETKRLIMDVWDGRNGG